ncbi:imidazolonepropionase [Halalkalicoccus paucihalophilus]|uniref:Imidazolonepropionase n=1 Tax=Halalkalicoccus paucihalophilus TaxID=1008153 RepID=A0A151AAN8_9EURY|nr:imidazolonepropionase [Halalkalicoccus paucihalophilus]KYH24664.1 imidazolonepropionase [Halalkalicoccus paucihalophilus]
MTELTTIVHDASEIVVGPGTDEPLERYENAAIAVTDGRVTAVGPTNEITDEYPVENATHAINADGKSVIPGFVDSHTHALFAGDRSDEFAAKLGGEQYQDILAEGGGILRTVRAVRERSDDELLVNVLFHLDTMFAHGTTTVEIKSGYGLDTETELRMLDVIRRADESHPMDVVPTFMGAHAVPEETDADTYTDRVIDEQLPAVADQGVAEFCDVFCEEDVFSVEQSRRVLEAGLEHGLTPKIHAEEFVRLGGAQLAAEVGATSADHLLHANEDDRAALTEAGVTPVLLPGTAFSLEADYADARAFFDDGGSVAVATDFNPNCYSQSMGFAIALACVGMGMTPAEALIAGTHSGARALDRTDKAGMLREGMPADMAIVDAPSHVHVPYNFGVNTVETVLKGGEPVHRGQR